MGAVVTLGCPSSVGPELVASVYLKPPVAAPLLLVGDRGALLAGAAALGLPTRKLERLPEFHGQELGPEGAFLQVGPELRAKERVFGKVSRAGGQCQLLAVEQGYEWAKKLAWPLVTSAVSKEAISHCGWERAESFRGHTEWLEALDGAPYSVMCFASPKLSSSLVTTHLPISEVPKALTVEGVERATVELAQLLLGRGVARPRVVVCSLNPHAGEGELLGHEEKTHIVPGIQCAAKKLGRKAQLTGPMGAETAFRKAAAGSYDGVVAIYHDQATIPMKLLDFGGGVNVTQGLSVVRTSVDHGTAYDIAGKGLASSHGLRSALELGLSLGAARAGRRR